MVTKHLEKLQQEKEKNSFAMIQALHADVGPTICALSLEETAWDVDAASTLLKRFKAENEDKLRKLLKVCQLAFFASLDLTWSSRLCRQTLCVLACCMYNVCLSCTHLCPLATQDLRLLKRRDART